MKLKAIVVSMVLFSVAPAAFGQETVVTVGQEIRNIQKFNPTALDCVAQAKQRILDGANASVTGGKGKGRLVK